MGIQLLMYLKTCFKTNLLIIHVYRYETKEQYIMVATLADHRKLLFDFLAFETIKTEAFEDFRGFALNDQIRQQF